MEIILSSILSYLIGLAANLRTSDIITRREEKLRKQLENKDTLSKAFSSTRPLRDELRAACSKLARNRSKFGVTSLEEPLWHLLRDELFQADLIEWFMAGGIEEGNAVKSRILYIIETTLTSSGASNEQIAFLKTDYFDTLDKVIFTSPVLAHWRHQLSLDYLREQVVVLRRLAEESAGVYSAEKQKETLDHYCEKALTAWDIIDLSNLPEGDIHMATQKLLLRQLYMPLRIEVEFTKYGEDDKIALVRLEEQREARRHREAGHLFMDDSDQPEYIKSRSPVGERLAASHRLIVLGDPGGGKTTMLRWMATAYLLRYKGDDAFNQIPDTQTLPDRHWIPVLIRCRDLGSDDLCRSFFDFLKQHLYKTELLPREADVMQAIILDRIAKGEALLLVDGLDEITNPYVRMMFCQELERTVARYPEVSIIVTSRIVGYRDMPYRMGSGFEHGQIAELNQEDKDLFARRWVEVTEQYQSADEKAKRVQELIDALHSNDRIERLTGSPMLLTTLALVKRKVGKLPNKRTKLYAEAVSVLLNWNPRVYQTIEEDEAIPQLEYLAYEMCLRGVQQLNDEEIFNLLEKVRAEYPHIRAIRRRESLAFLTLLEERSSILIKSGNIWQKNKTQEKPVWEFRHLTFQEYLAARALLDGRYPGRDKTKTLADQVAPLAAMASNFDSWASFDLKHSLGFQENIHEMWFRPVQTNILMQQVVEFQAGFFERFSMERVVKNPWLLSSRRSWRETIRLLVADCRDDDIDNVLLSILNPLPNEDSEKTAKERVELATICLADEPNVSNETAQKVLNMFVAHISKEDGRGQFTTTIDTTAAEVVRGVWGSELEHCLLDEFFRRVGADRIGPGGLLGMLQVLGKQNECNLTAWFEYLSSCLSPPIDAKRAAMAALAIMHMAFEKKVQIPNMAPALFALITQEPPLAHASIWALFWLSGGWVSQQPKQQAFWKPTSKEKSILSGIMNTISDDEVEVKRRLLHILGNSPDEISRRIIQDKLQDPHVLIRHVAAEVLGYIGDKQAVTSLIAKLDDPDADVRMAVIQALGKLGDKEVVKPLLAKLDDSNNSVRRATIELLGILGDKQAVTPLIARLDDPDADVQMAVIQALGKLGDKEVVKPLLAKLDDSNNSVRRATIELLGMLGDKQAIPSLIAKLDDPDANVRLAAIRALGKLDDKEVVKPLLTKLGDSNNSIRRATIELLEKLGDKQAITPLILLLEDRDYRICTAAAATLKVLGSERGSDSLIKFLNHSSPEMRMAAVSQLVRIRNKSKEEILLSRNLNGLGPWLDPIAPITETRITAVALKLDITNQEVRSLYESIAADFNLKFV
jgi:HEAT repeat protein